MDGTLTLLRDAQGGLIVPPDPAPASKRGILVLHGLPMGTIHDMRASIDAVMHEATVTEGLVSLEAIVLTTFPSFRVPDAVLRYAFVHTRRYASLFTTIHFVDLDVAKRAVFWVACRALPVELRTLVRLTTTRQLEDRLGATTAHRLETSSSSSPAKPHTPTILLDFCASKQGSGKGPLSSSRWKRKRILLSHTHLWYVDVRDPRLESLRLPLDLCRVEEEEEDTAADRSTIVLHAPPHASWTLCVTPGDLKTLRAVLEGASDASAGPGT